MPPLCMNSTSLESGGAGCGMACFVSSLVSCLSTGLLRNLQLECSLFIGSFLC